MSCGRPGILASPPFRETLSHRVPPRINLGYDFHLLFRTYVSLLARTLVDRMWESLWNICEIHTRKRKTNRDSINSNLETTVKKKNGYTRDTLIFPSSFP